MSSSFSDDVKKQLAHLRIPLEEIESATGKFSDANLLRKDGHEKEYKGRLLWSDQWIDIVARRLDNNIEIGNERFWMEMEMLSTLEHQNIVSMVGFCDENGEKIVIVKHDESTRGDLYGHLTDIALTWMQRLQICIGVARALSYIYYDEGRDSSAIHGNIKSLNILLGGKWEPKLSGFGRSMIQAAAERNNPCQPGFTAGTAGYRDPAAYDLESRSHVSHKFDMFSLGVVFFELLCGKGATTTVIEDGMYLYQSVISHHQNGRLYDLVDPDLWKLMGLESVNIFSETAYACFKPNPSERPTIDQILIQLEKALQLQQEHENRLISDDDYSMLEGTSFKFPDLQIPLKEIVSATDNFSDANLIREYGIGNQYKGQLCWSGQWIPIVARRFKDRKGLRKKHFWMEVSMLSKLEHQNIVSILGFCDENGEKIVIYKHETHTTLNNHLRDPCLTWMRRLEICIGVVRALSYIHYDEGRDFSVIHANINSDTILLDGKWEPKLSNFEFSIYQIAAERNCPCQVPVKDIWFTEGYSDPTYRKTGIVSHKSDMFSLGVVLFEIICGKGTTARVEEDEMYFYQSALSHFINERLDDLVHPELRYQIGPESFNIIAVTAYNCTNPISSDRPSIDQILVQLEQALESQREHEEFLISNATHSILEGRPFISVKLAHLKIPLEEIVSATNNFSDANLIEEDGFGKKYKGQLLRSGQWIDIAARRFSDEMNIGLKEKLFWREVSILSKLEHQNIVSIVGFCDENGEKIVIYKHETHTTLYNHLSDPRLTWMRRLEICIGVVRALSYIHYDEGRDFSVIHRNINSGTILLDWQWEPKLSGFEFSISQTATEWDLPCQVPDDDIWGTEGCTDPTYLETGSVSHESDMFSLGVVLFELLCGKSATKPVEEDAMYFYQSAKSHFENERLDDLVHPDLRYQIGPKSFNIIAVTAYNCTDPISSYRPSIDQILIQLEQALESQQQDEEFLISNAAYSILEGTPFISVKFAKLQISLQDIVYTTHDGISDKMIIIEDTGTLGDECIKFLHCSGPELIPIVARRLDERKGLRKKHFWREVSMLFKLEHQNIVPILGFCDENGEKIVIYKHETHTTLYNHLRDPSLTWMRRLEICIGVVRALNYIHYDEGRDFSIIHGNIKSENILLDGQWEPKLCGFEFSISQTAAERDLPSQVPNGDLWGTEGYCDPTYIQTGTVSHKSDMFSLGVVFFEVLCGQGAKSKDGMYLYESAKSHYEGKTLLYDLVDPCLGEHIHTGSFNIFSETAYCCLNDEPSERPSIDQILIQLDRALELQREHENHLISDDYSMLEGTTFKSAELRIPLQDIVSATDSWSDANLIRSDELVKEYKGQLMQSSSDAVDIVARRFDETSGRAKKLFLTEVSMLSKLEHQNIVSIVGFCHEDGEKIVINKRESTRGSLGKYLSDPSLTWMRRLEICVGVARALSYIYYEKGRDFSVIHRNINHFNILLDEQWKPKLSSFELSITQTTSRRDCLFLTDHVYGAIEYVDPTHIESGSVTHKSDIYSFGIVLFQVLCYRADRSYRIDYLARLRYEKGTLKEIIDPVLLEQMNSESFKIFSETAYYCLKVQRLQRPNIDQIIIKLEQALKSQKEHENPLISKASSTVDGTTTESFKLQKDLKHLKIPLTNIKKATNDFNKKYLIGSGGYGEVYKAELEHFDSRMFSPSDEKSIGELPKIRSIVAIKRIRIREDEEGQQGFLAEIEMLSSCKHRNIVSLLGFCEEDLDMVLVYELASKGSLSDHLGRTDKITSLSWVQRLKISIDIARGLNYLHTKLDGKRKIIHRDIKSDNILLSKKWEAKIADFGLSKFRLEDQQVNNTINTNTIAGTELYWDPEYRRTGRLKNESDIYSLGVVLLEILSGRFANDAIYTDENKNGIAHVARRRFNDKTIMEMVDPWLLEVTQESIFIPNRGPDKDSLKAFVEIAYRCVAESQADRPPAKEVMKKLKEALFFQENTKDLLRLSVKDIEWATQKFNDRNLIGEGRFSKLYIAEVTRYGHTSVAKRWHLDRKYGRQGEKEFLTELQVLMEYKHENIIGFVGYCHEVYEKIIVYEYASEGSLSLHLSNKDELTWRKRLEICIDIASGLHFLHGGSRLKQDEVIVIHRDINSYNVVLTHDWKAKITNFEHSLISPINKDKDFVSDDVVGTYGYADPQYVKSGLLTRAYDIYSLGVVLFEILCGRLAYQEEGGMFLGPLAEKRYNEGKLDEIVFEGIKDQIAPKSLTTFQTIALQCLQYNREERPTTGEVLVQLKEALEFQEDYEIWEPKLPKDYKEIFQMSNSRDIYSTLKAKDLYSMLCNGILLQQGKMLFTLHCNGERNGMISAKSFSYINRCPHKWRSIPESRFQVVAEILDILNLNIKIKTKTQLLSPDVVYGVYMVFKFCDPRNVSSKPVYVNLKYKNGSKNSTSHAYFATWRDNEWMMIELCRFLNDKENITFNFILESLYGFYCRNSTIYMEGIEFRAIDNVKHEGIKELKEVQQVRKSDSIIDLLQQLPTNSEEIVKRSENDDGAEKLLSVVDVNGKKHLMLSAKAAVYDYADVKVFKTKPSNQTRFPEVIEFLPQQVFRINCTIKSQMLSSDTEYACYLVFKLSEKCRGLHCPVKVRDLLHRNNKEVIYFRSPSPWNLHDTNQAPKQRADGWMEVKVWKFKINHELKSDSFCVNLKLISYEGTMSGLIVCGLEFQPM